MASSKSSREGELPLDPSRPVALLLGAGGVRGCAHTGVLTVLDQIGFSSEIVVGASIGSIFGAAYAADLPIDRIRLLTDRAPRRAVFEFYANRLRIDESTYIGRLLCELGTDTRIEDLPRKLAIMVLDTDTGKAVPITSGPLLQAVEASIALPGFARPVAIGSRTYIDGGLRGPIPSTVAYDLGAAQVIRVELVGNHPLKVAYRQIAKSRFLSLLTGLDRSPPISASAIYQRRDTIPELVITPQFYGLFCNSPIGIGFCSRQGKSAALRALTGPVWDRQPIP